MPVTDPIADMLARIRNAISVKHTEVVIPYSNIKSRLLKIMTSEGFVSNFSENVESGKKILRVRLNCYDDETFAIHGLKRVSTPGLRHYVGKNEIPSYYGGLSVAFLSTPKGIMTGTQARAAGLGGELLFYVW